MSNAPLWNNLLEAGEKLSKGDKKVLVEILLCLGELRFLAISLEHYAKPYLMYLDSDAKLSLDEWRNTNLEWVLTCISIIRSYIKALQTLVNKTCKLSADSKKILFDLLYSGETGELLTTRNEVEHNRHKLAQLIASAVRDTAVEEIDQKLNETLVVSCKKVTLSKGEMEHFISELKKVVGDI